MRFRVWGLGLKVSVEACGLHLYKARFGFYGLRFRVGGWGSSLRVANLFFNLLFGFRGSSLGLQFWVQGLGLAFKV